jgi:hypothetical protein
MELINISDGSKVAAHIKKFQDRIKSNVMVTISALSPESIQLTGALPRSKGWRIITSAPLRKNGRKDYIKFLSETSEKEVWIKLSTLGGRSKIYVR